MEEDAKMIDKVTECPYVVGNKITLQLEGRPVQATIVKTFEPWTNSCAMVLSFDSDLSALGIEGNVVLKVYDRRFSIEQRTFCKADPWTPEIERDLYKYLCSDEGLKFAIEHEKFCIKEREEDHDFMPTIIEEGTGEEQHPQNTCEQEGANENGHTNDNDDANSKGTLFKLSMLSINLLSPLFHAYKMAFRGLLCAIRFFHTGVTAVLPWRHQKAIDIKPQGINRNDEANGNNSTNTYVTTEEQQPSNLDAAVEDAGESEEAAEEEWDYLGSELDFCFFKQFRYESETEAYETMKDLQGIHIPRIFAHTKILGPEYTQDQPISRYFEHPGILMEYIEGFPLPDIAEHAPRKEWQPIIDKAVEIVNDIMSHRILNDDTDVRCFIVQPDPANKLESEYKFKLTMIDFGHTRFRRQYHPGEDWRWWEARDDGEGAIARVMERRLEVDHGGGYIYKRTPYRQMLVKDYMGEHCPQERPIPRDV
ncbi:hypothetical protein PEX2_099990 [Penicillium expansum]|uniref:Protein kinase domain-containing protein n=1 Tax=Penicillium expansum TaxID=27334 RepID=A0A0A2K251_PENEN|nr:hypothetical protein PEX2_099990 [Penicillium expansum]KGO60983.1 hypothetical protein PEX2_099990 [Penicillium expansum]